MNVLRRASTSTAPLLSLSSSVSTTILSAARAFSTTPAAHSRTKKQKEYIKRGGIKHVKPTPFDPARRTPEEWRTAELSEAEAARISSTPMSVRERRTARGIPEGEKMSEDGVSIVERLEYEKRRARGDFLDARAWPNGEPTPREWVDFTNGRRNRIRGRKLVPVTENVDGTETVTNVEDIVGRTVYLPDIVLRLIPNHTPPGQPYNPYEATFYIPHHGVTKTDIRSYLSAMYGLNVTYIRTDNYYAPIRARPGMQTKRYNKGIALKSRKRAVVGLTSPFIFPNMREDMTSEERVAQIDTLDEQVAMSAQIEDQKRYMRREQGLDPEPWGNRVMGKKNILRDRKTRRDDAEQNIQRAVSDMIDAAVQAGTEGVTTIRPEQIPIPTTEK